MSGELENPRWSVISERGVEAGSLTHEQARRLVHRLGTEGRHGLCIISDEAASRMEQWSEPGAVATGSAVESQSSR